MGLSESLTSRKIHEKLKVSSKVSLWEKEMMLVNPFPHDKILDETKLKAVADEKLSVTKMIISVFYRVENIMGKGEIACTSNFSFSQNVFKRFHSKMRQKVSLCGNGLIAFSPFLTMTLFFSNSVFFFSPKTEKIIILGTF